MDIKKYIESGILELYVAGILSEKENQEVYDTIMQYPEVLDEVLKIETTIIKLTSATAPKNSKLIFSEVKDKLGLDDVTKIVKLKPTRPNWLAYTGWAASILLAAGLFYTINQNNTLKTDIKTANINAELLESTIEKANADLAESKKLINILRDRDILNIPLGGQTASPEAYANVYWNKKTNTIYLDAKGLPKPPEGKVYQVWSLKLNPLTPTNLGTIDDFTTDDNKIFAISNANESEAFGITLEPTGGSDSPTLEQLYTLGTVASTP